ncbi:hypothetical protein J2Z44_001745 [Clostridium punense]|uniref:DUF6873 domain-containing protein n=1 Tax=Clostridium punense TaxID=1054297 RepID=A0ABS4K5L9_9CLOT|nr:MULTISPECIES: hypothetical protein [Clostridium]EQB90191.1 hypothetical protein M918_01550 [Clostridium sp. BL8]MBP2021949.1 hypothetical protein [Clostridium punense]
MKYAFVDYRISKEEKYNLESLDCTVIVCPPSPLLYEAISGHPDILIHLINNKNVIVHKDIDLNFIQLLKNLNLEVQYSLNSLKEAYPYDIILNAVNLKDYFIHNLKFTDKNLLNNSSKKKLINVNQGYTKCSTAVIKDDAIITSDNSIYQALKSEPIDVLLLPAGDIILPGLNYGFIGGTCGSIDDKIVFYGTLEKYKYGDMVLDFLKKHQMTPFYLSDTPLIDRGSILFL